jgi:serine/threonine-protein kinase
MTSCPFVEQVRRAYDTDLRPGTSQLPVVSPATGKRYTLACMTTGSYATCTGAVGAVIYLYNRPPP